MSTESERRRFEELYQEYKGLVRNVLYNMVDKSALDDLTQEVFLKIWKGLPKFAFRSSQRTWIYRVTVNVAIDYLRKPKIEKNDWSESELEAAVDLIPHPDLEGTKTQADVQWALQQIEEGHRSVVILFYFEELEIEEISKILEIPVGTVKSRLHNGRDKMKRLLIEKRGVRLEIE